MEKQIRKITTNFSILKLEKSNFMNSKQFLDQIENSLKQLANETDEVKQSEFFKEYLGIASKFWKYSYRNQILIQMQNPNASKVMGFKKWNQLGRSVNSEQKAISIIAPQFKKEMEIDPVTKEEKEVTYICYFPVKVFDISQTSGKELSLADMEIKGDNYKSFLKLLIDFCKQSKISVSFQNLGINGTLGYSLGGEICVSNNRSINTQVNTIIHEIAHELLHKVEDRKSLSIQQTEIQAEGTAYVVTKHFGLENKSFNYLALYNADYKKIMENLEAITDASKTIIKFLEEQLCSS